MASIYARGNRLWAKFRDASGQIVRKPTQYNVGQEEEAKRYAELRQGHAVPSEAKVCAMCRKDVKRKPRPSAQPKDTWRPAPNINLEVDALLRMELLDDWFNRPEQRHVASMMVLVAAVREAIAAMFDKGHPLSGRVDWSSLAELLDTVATHSWPNQPQMREEARSYLLGIGIAKKDPPQRAETESAAPSPEIKLPSVLRLSDEAVASIPPPANGVARTYYWDTDLKGFGLVNGRTRKTFVAMRRVGGKRRKISIGVFGHARDDGRYWTATLARREAEHLLRQMAAGISPGVEQQVRA